MIRGIFSGKGGVGKTTATANLGIALTKLDEKVILVDGDFRNPNLIIHLGCLDHGKSLQDIVEKEAPLLEALSTHETGTNFIPTHLSLNYRDFNSTKLKKVLTTCPQDILIDSPPGLTPESLSILGCCDEIFVVSQPLVPDITDCIKTIEVAKALNKKVAGIILNKRRNKKYELSSEEIEAICGTPIIAEIPWDEEFYMSLKEKTPLVAYKPQNRASKVFMKTAAKISGKEIQIEEESAIKRFMENMKRKFKK